MPLFCVSYAVDSSSLVQITRIECPKVTDVYQHMLERFGEGGMTISAIVEYRRSDNPSVPVGQ